MGTKHEVVSARTLRRAIKTIEIALGTKIDARAEEIIAASLSAKRETHAARAELEAALARKPNAVLQQLVYQLRTTRAELALVQETLEKNTAVIEKFMGAIDLIDAQRAETIRTLTPARAVIDDDIPF